MKFNWKNHLATGVILAGSLFYGCDNVKKEEQIQEKFSLLKEPISKKKDTNYPKFIEKSVKEIMAESKKFSTTIHFIYEIQKGSNLHFNDVSKLEKIIGNVEEQCEKKERYSEEEVIEILKATDKEIKNLGIKDERNKFDCDNLSFIYVAIGERSNINLYAVYSPEHVFIRYDPDGKHDPLNTKNPVNKGDFNWETLDGEIVKDNDYCGKKEKEAIEKGVYMKNLTKQKLIAQAFMNKGQYFFEKGDYNHALENYKKSLELDQNNPENYVHFGILFFKKKEYDLAIENYSKAIKLDANDVYAYSHRIDAYESLGKIEKANEDSKKVEEIIKKHYIIKQE